MWRIKRTDALNAGWKAQGHRKFNRRCSIRQGTQRTCRFIHGTPRQVSLPARSFAAVTLLDVLEHLRDPSEELVRVRHSLKKGCVLVGLPNTSFHLWKSRFFLHLELPTMFAYALSLKSLYAVTMKDLLRRTGFNPIRVDVRASETKVHGPDWE